MSLDAGHGCTVGHPPLARDHASPPRHKQRRKVALITWKTIGRGARMGREELNSAPGRLTLHSTRVGGAPT